MWYIENSLIGEDLMQKLLRTYILQNSLTSVNYTTFQAAFEKIVDDNFKAEEASKLKSEMDWDAWVH